MRREKGLKLHDGFSAGERKPIAKRGVDYKRVRAAERATSRTRGGHFSAGTLHGSLPAQGTRQSCERAVTSKDATRFANENESVVRREGDPLAPPLAERADIRAERFAPAAHDQIHRPIEREPVRRPHDHPLTIG